MNLAIMKSAKTVFYKSALQLKKYSPEILVAAGVVGTVASTVMACKATTKLDSILEETKEKVDLIHEYSENEEFGDRYSPEDAKKDLTIVYAQTAVKVAKLYAPAVLIGALSITSILASTNILRKRNIALAAAYATIDHSFKDYRKRVVERFGEEVDRQLKYNLKTQEIEETVVDPETGEETTQKKTVEVANIDGYSEYARFFDDGCKGWEKDAEMNLMFLRAQQRYANDLLMARGHLFLNEVYDMLGIERTKAGQVVGWVYDPDRKDIDNFVDFGFADCYKEKARDFINGYERTILLDFNVDGPILDLI